jgi:hypothetical protein
MQPMAYITERDPHRGWILIRAAGPVEIGDLLDTIRTARTSIEARMVPLLFDAREAHGSLRPDDVEQMVAAVQHAVSVGGTRGHVAIVAPDDTLYASMLRYETRCAEIGVILIRVFRQMPDARQWLEIVSASRNFR